MSKNKITIINNIIHSDELKLALCDDNYHHVLWFGASWCSPCQQGQKNLYELSDLYQPKNKPINVYKIDIENDQIMADIDASETSKIKVLSSVKKIPTILYFKDNSEQPDKRIRGVDKNDIIELLSSIDTLQSNLSEITDF